MAATTPRSAVDVEGLEGLDFGYSGFWTYGHLIPATGLAAASTAAIAWGAPLWIGLGAGALALWATLGFVVMRFVVRLDELGPLPHSTFAPGESRVLDLGCGAGRTSLMVALERPQGTVIALDDFSADYIDGHGEANTRSNLRAAGVDDRVEIRSGDMRQIPFPDASFDGVVSSAAIDHLKRNDIRLALSEANRVLRPKGQILLWLIVPNVWTFIAFGPLLLLHHDNASKREWREMLESTGFQIDDDGTTRGLAWMLATRTRKAAAPIALEEPKRPAIPRHVLWLSGGLIAGGVAIQLLGLDAPGLWIAGAGVVAIHLGGTFFGLAALRGWLQRRRQRRSAV